MQPIGRAAYPNLRESEVVSARRHTPLVVLGVAVALFAALPAAGAVAQGAGDDPSSAQYDPPIPDEEAGTASDSDSGGGESSGLEANLGFLPFTGLDLLIIAGVALVLAGTGFALRRATRHGPTG